MQLLAKLKKILYMGFRATLNFRKFKVRSCSVAMVTHHCVMKIIPTCSPVIGQFFLYHDCSIN